LALIPVRIYNTSRELVAELENATDIGYSLRINQLWTAQFSLPYDDDKTSECSPRRYAEIYDGDRRIGLFRIFKRKIRHHSGGKFIEYRCRHVLGTLNDDTIPGLLNGGPGTTTAINTVLGQQGTANWQLGTNDFSAKNYEYLWERQKLLRALLSIPERIKADYHLTFDTTSYPWTLNLVDPDTTQKANIDYGRNLEAIEKDEDLDGLYTRLYAYGFGVTESVGEVTIEGPNPTGKKYIDDNSYTAGVITHVWKDQKFTDEDDLYAEAQNLLANHSSPILRYSIDAIDLYRITGTDNMDLGDYVQITDADVGIDVSARVVAIEKQSVTGRPGSIRLTFANKEEYFPEYGDVVYADNLEDVRDGSGFAKVLSTCIEAGRILLTGVIGDLDDIDDGDNYAKVALTDIDAGHIKLVASTAAININDTTFGNEGIQLQYNAGSPRAYVGDGVDQYFKFENGILTVRGSLNADDIGAGTLSVDRLNLAGMDVLEMLHAPAEADADKTSQHQCNSPGDYTAEHDCLHPGDYTADHDCQHPYTTSHMGVYFDGEFSGNAPTGWTLLDLSDEVGGNRALVILLVENLGGLGNGYSFSHTNSNDYWPPDFSDQRGANLAKIGAGDRAFVVTPTTSTGKVYWKAQNNYSTAVFLAAFIAQP
jgi:phage minor structural protein